MSNKVHYVPKGYHSVTPYLTISNVPPLLDFLQHAFGGQVTERMERTDGSVKHAEVRLGDSMLMIGDPQDPSKVRPGAFYLYVPDVDATYQQALAAGATSISNPEDMFYGDRGGGVQDAWGNIWWIGTHIEDVSPEEIKCRAEAQNR